MTSSPFLLLRLADVFAPEATGRRDVLVAAGRILAMGEDLSAEANALGAEVFVWSGRAIPGLLDQHVHYLGGGEGDGPFARMPELRFEDLAAGGVTTAVGLLGSDFEGKTLDLLLRRAKEFERRGITALAYTGAMALPAPHLTRSVRSDLVLLDAIVGAKTAVSERSCPNLDPIALAALAGELVSARGMTGKAAVLHVHVGRLKTALRPIFDLIRALDLPLDMVTPSHVNRSPEITPLFEDALRFARMGGTIDVTCCLGPLDGLPSGIDPVEAVRRALDAGVPLERITLSSDAGVAVPDGRGGARAVPADILFRDVRRLVHEAGFTWTDALAPATTNVARVLRLAGRKGRIAPGFDADLVLLSDDDRIARVMAGGRWIHVGANDLHLPSSRIP